MNSLHTTLLNFLLNTKQYAFNFFENIIFLFKDIVYNFLITKLLIVSNEYNFYDFESNFYYLNKSNINFNKTVNVDFNFNIFFKLLLAYYIKKIKSLFLIKQYKDIINSFLFYGQMYVTYFEECLFGEVEYVSIKIFDIEHDFFLKNFKVIYNINLLNFFNKGFFLNWSVLYKFIKFIIIPAFLAFFVFVLLINFYSINIVKQLGAWAVVGLIFFWLISGFNFFLKRYRFGKFTSAIQRFWKRANSYFWLVEGFLFSLFFYYYLNSSQEPLYMYDESSLNQNHLFSLYCCFWSYTLLVFTIFYSFYFMLNLVNFNSKQATLHLTVITLCIVSIYLLETYQFYYVLTSFIETSANFNAETLLWNIEFESPRTRVKYQYLFLALIAKYWHFLFIFLSWLFFTFKCFEQKRVYYPFLGLNIQNLILLFGLNFLFYFQWIKWILKRYLENMYYWFFTDPNAWSFYELFNAISNFIYITILFKNMNFSFNQIIFKVSNNFFEISTIFRQLVKKYLYTINHKRLGLNYFYFSLITGMSGAVLATAIRLEMAYPGSPFFGGDSLKYLQVITAHALIMVFFVVVPIFFGGFANFLLPYHVGSKDVAFPRLNSLGFWIQPCGYLLIAKIGFIRTACWTNYDKTTNYFNLRQNNHIIKSWVANPLLNKPEYSLSEEFIKDLHLVEKEKLINFFTNDLFSNTFMSASNFSWKLFFWKYIYLIPDSFWFLVTNAKYLKRQKRHVVKCASATQTVSGWTFITPFSSKLKYTGAGIQDMLVLGVYYAGISTTISLVNLLATRRVLSIPGLRNRRILLPFISITILLMLRALAVITPVLGSAMLMLALDRHWQTSFFDFAYGGDPIFFHHLFWFFGHPEVYVLVIPAFGVINSVIPAVNFRRVASKHHLIWAIYIMNYMGFIVWGHHMYLIGLDHRSRALYSTVTIMISMPATIKVVNWTFTLVNGSLKNDLTFLSVVSFILFFLVAGFTGMWLSHVSLNISMHDTLYVVAHFHLMLSGAVVMGIFVGFYFYFNVFFQNKYSRTFGYIHIILYTGGQWLTFVPLFWVSFSGLPRRLHDFPAIYMGWQSMATSGHFVTMLGVLSFYLMILDSKIEKKMLNNIHSLVPRFNKRVTYYLGKLVYLKVLNKNNNYIIANFKTNKILNTINGMSFFRCYI